MTEHAMTPLAEALNEAEKALAGYRASGAAEAHGPAAIWSARLAHALETLVYAAAWQATHTSVRDDGLAIITPDDLAIVLAALRIAARRQPGGRSGDVLRALGHPARRQPPAEGGSHA